MTDPGSLHLTRDLLARAAGGQRSAQGALLQHTADRLGRLARHMLRSYPVVRRYAETDDIVQGASVRLVRALEQLRPATPREFLGLAALQIRRELIDLARHHARTAAGHRSPAPGHTLEDLPDPGGEDCAPAGLLRWTELHARIAGLPAAQREVVDLVFYQGLSQPEAAALLDVPLRTLQRRWHDALVELHRCWHGE